MYVSVRKGDGYKCTGVHIESWDTRNMNLPGKYLGYKNHEELIMGELNKVFEGIDEAADDEQFCKTVLGEVLRYCAPAHTCNILVFEKGGEQTNFMTTVVYGPEGITTSTTKMARKKEAKTD